MSGAKSTAAANKPAENKSAGNKPAANKPAGNNGGAGNGSGAGEAGAETADPSMEDILASIRRILSEDEQAEATAAPEQPPVDDAAAFAPPPEEDELVLDESMMARPVAPDPSDKPPPAKLPALPAGAGLLADETEAAAMASVAQLMRSLSNERQMQVYRSGPTLEDMVLEAMRPMLKHWLDLYLPPIVERLVQNEIERVTNRALAGGPL